MNKIMNSNGSAKVIAIALVAMLMITAVFGFWLISFTKAEFEKIYGFSPEQKHRAEGVREELQRHCETYLQARREREDLSFSLGGGMIFGAPGDLFDEFDAEVERAEAEIAEAKQDFIYARSFAEHFDFEAQVPACGNIRRPPVGIPR